jgi:hypothetical protein
LVVDAERGVLLRTAVRVDGQEVSRSQVTEITFDEAFPPPTFVFEPPPGERIRGVRAPDPSEFFISVEEVVARAPFTVFIPSEIGPGWTMSLSYFPEDERPARPPMVVIHYARRDATHQMQLTQMPNTVPDPYQADNWDALSRNGETWRTRTPIERWDSTQVQLEQDGTRVTLSSQDMPLETLLDLADMLQPASSEPPPLTE